MLDLRAGERVLDVAAGNGNATLAAARRWTDVTSIDYVASLLERGRAWASAEGLSVRFERADAESSRERRIARRSEPVREGRHQRKTTPCPVPPWSDGRGSLGSGLRSITRVARD